MGRKNWSKALKVLSVAALSSMFAIAPAANAQENTAQAVKTTTPIKHVVVIFQENVSFDHYFGTYPYALNVKGEPQFTATPGTPQVNNLLTPKNEKTNLISHNPNSNNPVRLDRSEAVTDDMDHGYTAEQDAADGGKMDKYVQKTAGTSWPMKNEPASVVMDYYDGNTVTGLWNYAQHFAMSDNSYGTVFGPSTPGALNLVSGNTHGAKSYTDNAIHKGQPLSGNVKGEVENGTVVGDPNPYYDKATSPSKDGKIAKMLDANKNVGDLLNAKNLTWGWFQGGFADTSAQHKNVAGAEVTDYSPHHEPFQYYTSTANPNHLPPSSAAMIGKTDQANHQYDLKDFWKAVDRGNMPSVSYLKAPMSQDGHAGYSDPLDEQTFIVNTINHLEKSPDWSSTAVIISYDDSDGFYDHVYGPSNGQSVASGRAGYGPRLPLIVISPYAKQNYVDHTLTDQSSILKFIEDNWNLGRIGGGSLDAKAGSINAMFDFSKGPNNPKLFLDPSTGETVRMYTVKAGDTLGTIAAQYHVMLQDMVKLNNLNDPNRIYVDQKLVLPSAK